MNTTIIWLLLLSLLNIVKTNYTFLGTNYAQQTIEYEPVSRNHKQSIILGTSDLFNTYFVFVMSLKHFEYGSILQTTCYVNGTKEANLTLTDNRFGDKYEKYIQGYCLMNELKLSGKYLYINNSLIVATGKENVNIDSNFEIDLNPGKYGLKLNENIIIFRQVNSFNQKDKDISFIFHGLNIIPENEIETIILEVEPLIGGIGVQKELINVNCSLLNKAKTKNVSYKCQLELNSPFNSLRIISSKEVSNIPRDIYLSNPFETDKRIKSGIIVNYSNPDVAKVIPPIISVNNIRQGEEGKVIIDMTSSDDLEIENDTFTIPLGLPVGVELFCNISKVKANETIISECFIDGIIDEEIIAFETMRIMKGKKELFILMNYISKKLKFNCSKSLKEKAEEKLNLTLSFRQALSYGAKYNYFTLYIFESNSSKFINEREKNITILGNIISDFEEELKNNPLEIICPCELICGGSKGAGECYCQNKNPLVKFESIILIDNRILSGFPQYEILKNPNSIMNIETPKRIFYESEGFCNIDKFNSTYIEGNLCSYNGEFTIRGDSYYSNDNAKEFILFITYPPAKAKCKIKNGKIKCISGNTFENKIIMIEQQSVYNPFLEEEYFVITSIKSDRPITCLKGNITIPTEEEITKHITTLIELMNTDKPMPVAVIETDKVNLESTTKYEAYKLIPSDNTDKTILESTSLDTSSQTSLIITTNSSTIENNSINPKPNPQSKSKGIIIVIIVGSAVVVIVAVILIVLGIKGKICKKNKNKNVNKKPEEEPYDSSNTINTFGPQK